MDGDIGTLEFDLGQKWAKGLRIHFCNARESRHFEKSDEFNKAIHLKQIHSSKFVRWSSSQSPESYKTTEADGLLGEGQSFKTHKPKFVIRTADCCPLFYIDRENERVAALHAGWRGLAQGIHLKPFQEGFDPKFTWIWCGPCLSGDVFEVQADMWENFSRDTQLNENIFKTKSSLNEKADPNKRFFDCWEFLKIEYQRLGVELFYNVEINTYLDPHFNSYRRWNKGDKNNPLAHNYSWISFI